MSLSLHSSPTHFSECGAVAETQYEKRSSFRGIEPRDPLRGGFRTNEIVPFRSPGYFDNDIEGADAVLCLMVLIICDKWVHDRTDQKIYAQIRSLRYSSDGAIHRWRIDRGAINQAKHYTVNLS